jgi:3-dehydroquinate dehydratase-2
MFFLNGPNGNLDGLDKDGLYGDESVPSIERKGRAAADRFGLALEFLQSNHEGFLVDWIQEAMRRADAMIINTAGYSDTSIAIPDALRVFDCPVIEVQMSNLWKRAPFRHQSYVPRLQRWPSRDSASSAMAVRSRSWRNLWEPEPRRD